MDWHDHRKKVIVSQKPFNEKGAIEYDGLDNQKGTVIGILRGAGRFSVRLDPTEDKLEGTVVNFRVEDLVIAKTPTFTK